MRHRSDAQDLREYLITTTARLIGQRGSAGLSVRDITREAQVADGVLYNYFEDQEDLLAHALLAHVGTVMGEAPQVLPEAGTGTLAENLQVFMDRSLGILTRVLPAFAGLLSQPKVLSRFQAMVGAAAAFGAATADERGSTAQAEGGDGGHPRGLPDMLTAYLRAEQRLGRIDPAADAEAASLLIIGAVHGQVLPRLVFSPPGTPVTVPPGLTRRFANAVLSGIAPGVQHSPGS